MSMDEYYESIRKMDRDYLDYTKRLDDNEKIELEELKRKNEIKTRICGIIIVILCVLTILFWVYVRGVSDSFTRVIIVFTILYCLLFLAIKIFAIDSQIDKVRLKYKTLKQEQYCIIKTKIESIIDSIDLRKFCGIPENIKLADGLPTPMTEVDTRYVKCDHPYIYHDKENCLGPFVYLVPRHAYRCFHFRPCQRCVKEPLREPKWFAKYEEVSRICKHYDIEILKDL